MLKESFSSIFKKNHYLVVENSEGVLNHLTHLEELILTKKKYGVELAATFIKELLKTDA